MVCLSLVLSVLSLVNYVWDICHAIFIESNMYRIRLKLLFSRTLNETFQN